MASSSTSSMPQDAQVMAAIVRDMGVTEYEPRVLSQLLEFAFRYTSDVLIDARTLSEHAGKKAIDADDVRLAIDTMIDSTFTQPPPRQLLQELAKEKNAVALPPIKQAYGARLPNDRFCLLQPNYRWKNRNEIRNVSSTISSQRSQTAQASSQHQSQSAKQPNVVFQLTSGPNDGGSGQKRKVEDASLDEDYDHE
uniref:Transcription initiation factor TFIID subunit 9 n=1 Tax=Plectus sambesii TaxID=2011161 RepID=A0A914XMI7_9BILA